MKGKPKKDRYDNIIKVNTTKRLGFTKPDVHDRIIGGVKIPKGEYLKAGIMHRVDLGKDSKIKSKLKRKGSYSSWRGDVEGSSV
jgi:hypothetical protein